MLTLLLRILLVVFSLSFAVHCGGQKVTTLPETITPPEDDQTEEPDASAFSVSFEDEMGSTTIPYVLRTSTSYSASCEVAAGTSASTDRTCYLDVPEGHLYFFGATLNYNVPADMCTYLRRRTYWYYNYEVGTGPEDITMTLTINPLTNTVTTSQCTVDGDGPHNCTTAFFPELSFDVDEQKATCIYDGTANGDPNCCFGTYTLTKVITNDDGTNPPTTTTVQGSPTEWGGNYKKCIGGPGRTSWAAYTVKGVPISVVTNVQDTGIVGDYVIKPPINILGENYSIANYYHATDHTHNGFVSATNSALPYFIDPVDDRTGDAVTAGQPYYEFSCLDDAFEVVHRLKVYIRDWDTLEDFNTYKSTAGVTEVMDQRTGISGTDCDGVAGDPCNSHWDLDDFLENLHSGTYDTTAGAVLDRGDLFPKEDYE